MKEKSLRSQLCFPVSQQIKVMVHSNYCHISWAKDVRSKYLINSFFPMAAILQALQKKNQQQTNN